MSTQFAPSTYQEAIFKFAESGTGNAVVNAVAGSGKTTTLLELLKRLEGKARKPLFCAFNKSIAEELRRRAPTFVTVSTIHALGFSAIRRAMRGIQVNGEKTRHIVREIIGDGFEMSAARTAAAKLASTAKLTLTPADDTAALDSLMDIYDIDANGDTEIVLGAMEEILTECMEDQSQIDFDDMVWFPHVLKLKAEQYDFVFVDEAQDLNAAQRDLVLKSVMTGGRLIAVGDRRQAIYGFAGASTTSIDHIIKATKAVELPLSICYRCPSTHVRLAKGIVPQIESRVGAPEGEIQNYRRQEGVREMGNGDLVICRTNAPLAEIAMDLVRRGQKVTIRGKDDLAKGLLTLIEKQKGCSHDLPKLLQKLVDYRDREVAKYLRAKKEQRAEAIKDKIETLLVLAEGLESVQGLKDRIASIFSEDKSGVVCSSVHRAKGLEADRVFIYRPELMPHPKASEGWQLDQEMNLKYVALTRAKRSLFFVDKD